MRRPAMAPARPARGRSPPSRSGVLLLAGLLLLGSALVAAPAPIQAQEDDRYDWVDTPPERLRGTWALNTRCASENSEMLIFSDGGYRWRKADGSWGFARGAYAYNSPTSSRVLFKVKHLLMPTPGYDAVLTVSGRTLVKTNLKSNTSRRYGLCADW